MASKAGSNMPMYFQPPQMCLMKFCAIYYTLLPYTWGTSNSKLPGPSIVIDQSEILSCSLVQKNQFF
jgi:hypothetical protein